METTKKIVRYKIEDIKYILVRAIEEGELVAELEFTRVPDDENYFIERSKGEGICPYCGVPYDNGTTICTNPDCPGEDSYYHESDIADYLNGLNEYKSYIVKINDKTYKFKQ